MGIPEEFINNSDRPTSMEMIYYVFLDKGIDYNAFNKLPIPYILGMLKTLNYVKEEEAKAMKKANKKAKK